MASTSSSSVERFERTLADTVAGEKLSGSRVEKVKTQALQEFHHAEQVATAIQRAHRQASSKAKISSLYLFDAVARSAQDVIRKRGSGFDYRNAKPPKGSKAKEGTKEALMDAASAFLGACSRIVEEIVLSTAQSIRADQRDKVTKVVDIWIKANTFDSDLLERIRSKAMRGEGGWSNDESRKDDFEGAELGSSMPSPCGAAMNDEGNNRSDERGREGTQQQIAAALPPNVPSSILAMLGGGTQASKKEAEKATEGSEGDESITPSAEAAAASVAASAAKASIDPNQLAMLRRVAAQQQQQQQQGQTDPSNYRGGQRGAKDQGNAGYWQTSTASSDATRREAFDARSPPQHQPQQPSALTDGQQPGHDVNQPHFRANDRVGDLSHFDMSTFDPTKANEWLKLAQHWYNTYQYVPSNQELMTGLMSVMQSQMYLQSQMLQGGSGMAMDFTDASNFTMNFDGHNATGGSHGAGNQQYW